MILKTKRGRFCGWIIFYTYLVLLAYFLFFSERYGRTFRLEEYRYNLTLFQEIRRYFQYHNSFQKELFILNMFGNVLAFVPFGFLLPLLDSQCKKPVSIAFLSFEVSLLVELVQLISKTGIFDIDDILLNTAGGVIGYLFYFIFLKCKKMITK